MKTKNFKFKSMALVLFALVLSSNVWGYTGTFSDYMSSTLIDGIYVVASSSNASSAKAMGTTISSGRLTGQTVSTSNPGDALVWYIEYTADGWTFKNYSNSKYLKQNTTTSGKGMSLEDTPGYFNLDGYNSTSPVGYKFSSKDQTSNQYFKYNNSSSWFSNYTSGYSTSMTPIRLYRLPKYRAKTTQPGTGSFMASASDATWDATNNHLSWLSSGTTVTLTATPPSGKEVDSWTVTKASGGTVTVSNNTFSMPADQVTISVTWKTAAPSCTNKVTVTKNSATGGSYTLKAGSASGSEISNGGTVDNCDANATIVVVPNANSNYHCTGVTASNSTSVTGPDGSGNYTITYTQGSSISSTINVTFAEDTKYTISFQDNIQLEEVASKEVYDGATFTFPDLDDRTATTEGTCEQVHYHFMGWVISTHTGEITVGDIKTGTSDAVNANATYKAVWAKEDE